MSKEQETPRVARWLDPHIDPHVWTGVARRLANRKHSTDVLRGLLHSDRPGAVRWLWD